MPKLHWRQKRERDLTATTSRVPFFFSNDKIFEQTLLSLDGAGNTLKTALFQRNVADTSSGALTTSHARMTYMAFWQDGLGRQIAAANYGTSDPGDPPPDAPPPSSPTILVSQIAYNSRGEAYLSTDPAGMMTRTDRDDAGRQIRVIQNYQTEVISTLAPGVELLAPACECGCCETQPAACAKPTKGADVNATTLTTYTPDDNVATLTALNPNTGGFQTTRYLYGTTLATSAVARNDLLVAVLYPDAADSTDGVQYQYNLQSQVRRMQDQNGTIHDYAFDGLGRRLADKVTQLGANVDAAVQRIDTAYEIRGMVSTVTSYADTTTGTMVNQVTLAYNDFGQLDSDDQNLGTGLPDQAVTYTYADGSANTIRRESMVYPYSSGTRTLGYLYGSTGGDDGDSLSRVTDLSFATVSPIASYSYFGLGSFAKVNYPQPGASSTLATSSPTYPGFDKFNRIINLPWTKSTSGDLAGFTYTYDQASNRLRRLDTKATASGKPFDEVYTYDGLHRLKTMTRGTFDTSHIVLTAPTLQQRWGLDATGNWTTFTNSDFTDSSNVFDQQRTSNAANEITKITTTVGANVYPPVYDRNGNMQFVPYSLYAGLSAADGYAATYDAWNRLTTLALVGPSPVAAYSYDGLNRRTVATTYDPGIGPLETRYFFYSDQWQVIEEQVEGATYTPDRQFVWGLRYIDDLILRDGSTTGILSKRWYALQDANWNVVALANTVGSLFQRFCYTPYGVPTFLNEDFTPGLNDYSWETLFCGYRYEIATGMYLARERWLQPPLGCWLTRDIDPFAQIEGPYRYVRSNPINDVDPFGLQGSYGDTLPRVAPLVLYAS